MSSAAGQSWTRSHRIASSCLRIALALVFALAVSSVAPPARAGVLTRTQVEALFPAPLIVGDLYASLPVWPIFERRRGGLPVLVAQAFETIDIEPVGGYSGKPINLLVVVDRDGTFRDVKLLGHAEPIFRSPKGNATLGAFAEQYQGLTLSHSVQLGSPKAQRSVSETTALLHGVTTGTVSALAIDRSIMESAARVAAARLADPNALTLPAEGRGPDDRYTRRGWNELVGAGLLQHLGLTNRELEARFAGTPAAGRDAEAALRPDAAAIDLWVSLLGLPEAGRNLLDAGGWRQIRRLREGGSQVLLVLDGGRYPLKMSVRQSGREFELHELRYVDQLTLTGQRSGVDPKAVRRLLQTDPASGLDIAQPMTLVVRPMRRYGSDALHRSTVELTREFAVPNLAAYQPMPEAPRWHSAWAQRSGDLAVLVAGLVVLVLALALQRPLSAVPQRLARFRVAYLLFTLVFIGWVAQGQLTIVNLTSMIGALVSGDSAGFLLNDPMTIVLWAFVGVTLFVWGRGTFCGWLCPFGALQELLSLAARSLGFKQRLLHHRTDSWLKHIKYAVLATLVVAAFTSDSWATRLVEVEPFKTSISLYFQREWPYVLWAAACITATLFVYRGYCRYLCPLGAGLALFDRVRLWAWIPRRSECGTPCQTCRHRCAYQAIEPKGKVNYAECFQCLDCVSIHDDATRCMPLIREHRGKVIALRPVPA